MVIVSVNHCLKEWDVQSGPCGEMMCRSGGGSGVGSGFTCGLVRRNCVTLFLDNISALRLLTPVMCSVTMCISNTATKNHKVLSKCITVWSLEDPFVMAATSPRLSH